MTNEKSDIKLQLKKDTKEEVVDSTTKSVEVKETKTEVSSPWYFFYSQGCAFCKQLDPIIDEFNKNGHDILKLDIADVNNRGLKEEIQNKYNKQCGTPWLVNSETGNAICGWREKEAVQNWLDGEDVPEPPRPKGPPPRPPFHGVTKKEEKEWIKKYDDWLDENSHLPDTMRKPADEILAMPRPKTEPPKPPNPGMTEDQLKEWAEKYDMWKGDNDHLPNLKPSDEVLKQLEMMKRQQSQQQSQQQAPAQEPINIRVLEDKLSKVENQLSKLMTHLGVK